MDNFFDKLLWEDDNEAMPLFFDGVLKLVSNQSFVGETGETVAFFKHYFQGENGSVFEIGSKQDFSKYIDVPVEVQIIANKIGKDWRLQLTALVPTKD